jgi:hypothetical protein
MDLLPTPSVLPSDPVKVPVKAGESRFFTKALQMAGRLLELDG